MSGSETTVIRDANGRFVPGQSGNPAGKRPGTRNRASLLAEALLCGEAEGIARIVIDKALAGDAVAARFCLERLSPKPRSRAIRLALPDDGSAGGDVVAMFNSALRAMAAGEITPEEAVAVARFLEGRVRVLRAFQLERKLTWSKPVPGDDWTPDEEEAAGAMAAVDARNKSGHDEKGKAEGELEEESAAADTSMAEQEDAASLTAMPRQLASLACTRSAESHPRPGSGAMAARDARDKSGHDEKMEAEGDGALPSRPGAVSPIAPANPLHLAALVAAAAEGRGNAVGKVASIARSGDIDRFRIASGTPWERVLIPAPSYQAT